MQDIHIALTGLPAGRTVVSADIQGLGGGDWQYQGGFGPWDALVLKQPGATTGDVFLEPYQVETGRPFSVVLTYDDGSVDATWVNGGAADPNLRMPSAKLSVASASQDGRDLVGVGPDVGPDGLQDLHLHLTGLSAGVDVSGITVTSGAGDSWADGNNPAGLNNAELVRDEGDPTQADLYLQPTTDLTGQTLGLALQYANGKTDSASYLVTGPILPNLPMPLPAAPPTVVSGVSASWLGQDGLNLTGPGDAHLVVSGLPSGRTVVAGTLSDPVGGEWAFRTDAASTYYIDPFTPNLGFRADGGGKADLTFAPSRNESGSTLTLRLLLDDGSMAVVTASAGSTDPGLRIAGPASTSVVAHPGDDLNSLANSFGSVHLSAGTYNLSAPLVLNHPVNISADPGATLLFSQASGSAPWTTAVLVQGSHTSLDGFAVRFAGPINWNQNVQFGPAVVGSSNNIDPGTGDPLIGLSFTHLDLQAPPAASSWEVAPSLFRLVSASSGTVANNTLKGGTTEVTGGPWRIVDNNYLGTMADTFTPTAFATHFSHDLVLEGNRVVPAAGSGKTYRFLVMNGGGQDDTIDDNTVVGVGPMDADNLPDENASEVLLTEDYDLHYEGMPSALTDGGSILQIPGPQGIPAAAGDVVAILSGPDAGQWRTIAQAIDPNTYLLNSPLPLGDYAISIATGFVGETYSGNTIDTRGSSTAADMVLLGAHFGTQVTNNTLIGGSGSMLIAAPPTEFPNGFGWSHTPFLGAQIDGNTIEDSLDGATLSVIDGSSVKSSVGRVYFSGSFDDNNVVWTDAFLAAHPSPTALTIGDSAALDPTELRLEFSGNTIQMAAEQPVGKPVTVNGASLNGQTVADTTLALPRLLPAAPTALRLVNDTGSSPTDALSSDGHLSFAAVPGAASYEYEVGSSNVFLPVSDPSSFLPTGLTQGSNTVSVRAVDAFRNRGPLASITFSLDSVSPATSPPSLAPGQDTGVSATDGLTDISAPTFTLSGDPADTITLYRGNTAVGSRTGPGTISEPLPLADGVYSYTVRRVDPAGNASTSPSLSVTIDATPPTAAPPTLTNDSGLSATDGLTDAAPIFAVAADPTDRVSLLRNGVVVASRTGAGTIADTPTPADGAYLYRIARTDLAGNSSTSAGLSVTIDTSPPTAAPPVLTTDTGASASDGITSVASPVFSASADPTDRVSLLRNGTVVASRVGPGTMTDPATLKDGAYLYTLARTDAAGNASTSPALPVTIDRTPPSSSPPQLAAGSDSGRSATDGITNVAAPAFVVSGDPTDAISLLRNGVVVAGRTGPGTLVDPTATADGAFSYTVQRADLAGNVSTSPALPVTIDRTPPTVPAWTITKPSGVVQVATTGPTDGYAYRVGTGGPYTSVGLASSFLPGSLASGLNVVQVHAVDVAGNVGPDSTLLVNTAPTAPSGAWLGQDGKDLVGPSSVVNPDGVQDIHIALAGLRAGRTIAAIDVRGLGGGEWTYRGPFGVWAAQLVRASSSSTTADLYLDPYQVETGRPLSVDIRYDSGQRDVFWVQGGPADPSKHLLGTLTPAGTIRSEAVSASASKPKLKAKHPAPKPKHPAPKPTHPAGPASLARRGTRKPKGMSGPGRLDQCSLRTFCVTSRSQTLHHFQRLGPMTLSRWLLAAWTVRNQTLASASPTLSSLPQRAKCSRFEPALTAAGRLASATGIVPWKTKPIASRRVSAKSSGDSIGRTDTACSFMSMG